MIGCNSMVGGGIEGVGETGQEKAEDLAGGSKP